jgi:hypothetical protein
MNQKLHGGRGGQHPQAVQPNNLCRLPRDPGSIDKFRCGFFTFVSFVSLVSILSGCASSHRASKTTKTVEWFQDRQDGLVERITFLDKEAGGGVFLLTDPKVSAMSAIHTNQDALGGGSMFSAGQLGIIVDTNTAQILNAAGTATGNVIGAAAKAALK